LLTAFKVVVERVPDAELLLVGDGPLRTQLERQTQDLGLTERVHFKGQVADIWPLLAGADVFALSSRYEPLGLAALEAMAAGLPVVASRVDGLAALVEPGVTGQLVTCGDSLELADRLVDLLTSPATIAAMSRASQSRAKEYRADRMADGYARLYESLLEAGENGARP
jgi:glycosyltransferase involved in cell wall biosynthesis